MNKKGKVVAIVLNQTFFKKSVVLLLTMGILFLAGCGCNAGQTNSSPGISSSITEPSASMEPTSSSNASSNSALSGTPAKQNTPKKIHVGGKIYSTEFPIPTADTFGLTGTDATLYNLAVDQFSNAVIGEDELGKGSTTLVFPALTLLGSQENDDGTTTYVVTFRELYFSELGDVLKDLKHPVYNYGFSSYLESFIVDKNGKCISKDSLHDDEGSEGIKRVCGSLKSLADFLIRNQSDPINPADARDIPQLDEDQMLQAYLNYFFEM